MHYSSLEDCIVDLEKHKHLVRITEPVDGYLEMAAIHLRIHEANGPALLFERVNNSNFRAASNLFGTLERSKFIFRHSFKQIQQLIKLKSQPLQALKKPFSNLPLIKTALHALPLKNPFSKPITHQQIRIQDLPLIHHWKNDGGAFVTLPQVYTEDVDKPGIMQANLGMYRIQLTGNQYELNKEIGLHYQLHRGIGVHQTKANKKCQPLKVSCFVGGPPSHTLSAVMPLPEGLSEMTFAGALAGRRFRYFYDELGYCVSADADFVITGYVLPNDNKPEGPFGDHLGYYSLQHPFPVMNVEKVYARKNAIWPFTVVGRPPQEDTAFGALIHELTGEALQAEIPGLIAVNAVDAAGVHPLLLAIGSERYTPFLPTQQPAELLTIANHMLGKGQLSLAKYVYITAPQANEKVDVHHIEDYLQFIFERIQWHRDVHVYTNTSIDTLDYSGTGLNTGSKVVFAAYGNPVRTLCTEVPEKMAEHRLIKAATLVMPGVICLQMDKFTTYTQAQQDLQAVTEYLKQLPLDEVAQIIIADDAKFVSAKLNNYLWVTYTRSNPSHDIYGVDEHIQNKHWGCNGPLIIDARIKPHHAPAMEKDTAIEKKIDRLFEKGGSLYGLG